MTVSYSPTSAGTITLGTASGNDLCNDITLTAAVSGPAYTADGCDDGNNWITRVLSERGFYCYSPRNIYRGWSCSYVIWYQVVDWIRS